MTQKKSDNAIVPRLSDTQLVWMRTRNFIIFSI